VPWYDVTPHASHFAQPWRTAQQGTSVTLLLSDRKLLDAFRRGDRWAIERVYHAYVDQVARLLQRGFHFVSSGATHRFNGFDSGWELECAVQDAFIQAFSPAARQSYDGVSPFGPFLLTIARNRVISQLRSESREARRRTSLAAQPAPDPPESPERQALRQEARALVAEFKATLPDELRRFCDARYGEERNLLDAARHLGLTRMRARLRDRKLLQLFTEFLERRGYLGTASSPPRLLLTIGGIR
jgi:RNA polymerase sigma factor (sigma-70 family)